MEAVSSEDGSLLAVGSERKEGGVDVEASFDNVAKFGGSLVVVVNVDELAD